MILELEPLAGTQPQLTFVRPIGEDFQIGEFLIRRADGDRFVIWNADGDMLATDAGKLESTLRDFFSEEF
jgi:hypothetical protein